MTCPNARDRPEGFSLSQPAPAGCRRRRLRFLSVDRDGRFSFKIGGRVARGRSPPQGTLATLSFNLALGVLVDVVVIAKLFSPNPLRARFGLTRTMSVFNPVLRPRYLAIDRHPIEASKPLPPAEVLREPASDLSPRTPHRWDASASQQNFNNRRAPVASCCGRRRCLLSGCASEPFSAHSAWRRGGVLACSGCLVGHLDRSGPQSAMAGSGRCHSSNNCGQSHEQPS